MSSTDWPVYSPFAKKHFGQGKLAGRAEECAKVLLLVLGARGIELTRAIRDRITSCTDLERLELWATRAASVKTADELFDDPR